MSCDKSNKLPSNHVSPSIMLEFDYMLNILPVPALIDTAATVTVIDQSWCKQIGLKTVKVSPKIPYKDVSGAKHFIKRKTVDIDVAAGEYAFTKSFYIINSPSDKIILGWDWFSENYAKLDCTQAQTVLLLGGTSVPVSFARDPKQIIRKLTTDVEPIPDVYDRFGALFDPNRFLSLPPSRGDLDMAIDILPGKTLPTARSYPMSLPEMKAVHDVIDPEQERGIIRPSKAPNGAPVFFVRKGDNGRWMVINYSKTNESLRKDKSPLPLVTQMLKELSGVSWFTKLDMPNAFKLLRIREGDEWKAAFTTPFGAFEPLVVQFGLCNAPAVFQSFMNQIFSKHLYKIMIVYIDDILIYTRSPDLADHIKDVTTVMEILEKEGLQLRAEKCLFHKKEIEFLGFQVNTTGVQIQSKKTEAILNWRIPAKVKEVQQFLGFANFVRKFVKNFAEISQPLTRLVRNNVPFIWDNDCDNAFTKLKQAIISAPVLVHHQEGLPCVVESDASDFALGAVLSQEVEGVLHPVAYYSRRLTGAEINYQVYDKELLAIVEVFREWRVYLDGVHTTVFADHRNLEHFKDLKTPLPRQVRWGWKLQNFDFDIVHRPGKLNARADALSRKEQDYEAVQKEKENLTFNVFPESHLIRSVSTTIPPSLSSSYFIRTLTSSSDLQKRKSSRKPRPFSEDSWKLNNQLKNLEKYKNLTKSALKVDAAPLVSDAMPNLIINSDSDSDSDSDNYVFHHSAIHGTIVDDTSDSETFTASQPTNHQNHINVDPLPIQHDSYTESISPSLNTSSFLPNTEKESSLPQSLSSVHKHDDSTKAFSHSKSFLQRIRQAYKTDNYVQTYLHKGIPSSYKRAMKGKSIKLIDNLYYVNNRLYIPSKMVLKLIQSRHDEPLVGHKGVTKTFELLRRDFWWPSLYQDVRHFVFSCHTCARIKPITHKPFGLLKPLKVPFLPWEEISMDYITDLPLTARGFENVWVVVCRLTKMAHFVPVGKTSNSKDLAQLIIDWVIRLHGAPKGIISDRGGQFNSVFWSEVSRELEIKLHLSTAFHP